MNSIKQIINIGIILALLSFSSFSYAKPEESVGKLIFTIGKVIIKKQNGESKRVRRGAKVFEGDLITTNKKGQAQIKFIDGARISVRPNSEFKVEAYVYNKKNKNKHKSELNLLKGGIRAVTGAIGKSNKKSYKLKTVIATIGIRGTDYSLMLCNKNCGGARGQAAKSGLYVGVVSGGISLRNNAGTMDLAPNQYAMVGSRNTAPKILPNPPSFLMFDRTPVSKSERTKTTKKFTEARKKSLASRKNKNSSNKNANRSSQASTQTNNSRKQANLNRANSSSRSQTNRGGNQSQNNRSNQTAGGANNNAQNTTQADSGSSSSSVASIISDRYADPSESSDLSTVDSQISSVDIPNTNDSPVSIDDQVTENIQTTDSSTEINSSISELNTESLIEDVTGSNELDSSATGSSNEEDLVVAVGNENETDSNITTEGSNENIDPTDTGTSGGTDTTTEIAGGTDDGSGLNEGSTNTPQEPTGLTRFFSFIFGDSDQSSDSDVSQVNGDKVDGFFQSEPDSANFTEYSQDTATLKDYGYDPETGLSWGRWTTGYINKITHTENGSTSESVDMTNQSLHWLMGPEGSDTVQLPITGTRNYVLIGNTNPTDNMGNVGILGFASLSADFDNQSVDTDVKISINENIWQGSQQNIPLDMNNGGFNTDQLNVNVTGGTNTSGSLSGGLVEGTTNGAGFTYGMEATIDGEINKVNGAAVFKEAP